MPSLVHKIIARLGVEKATWDQELRLIEKLANERDAICEAILQLPKSEGKKLLQATLCGSALPAGFEDSSFLQKVKTFGALASLGSYFIRPH